MFWWLTIIQQNFVTSKSPHNQHSSRKFKRKYFNSQSRISAYNRKLLIMSAFMFNPCMATLFSNPMYPETVWRIHKYSEHTGVIVAPPWNYFMYCYNQQPSQGLIVVLIFFSTVIISTVLSFMQL